MFDADGMVIFTLNSLTISLKIRFREPLSPEREIVTGSMAFTQTMKKDSHENIFNL